MGEHWVRRRHGPARDGSGAARGGRDSIDHAPGAHDDVANAAAGALVAAAQPAPLFEFRSMRTERRGGFNGPPDHDDDAPGLRRFGPGAW